MKTTWLQFADYDENGNCTITDFEVPEFFLLKTLGVGESGLLVFLDEYTSNEAFSLFNKAKESNLIINIETK